MLLRTRNRLLKSTSAGDRSYLSRFLSRCWIGSVVRPPNVEEFEPGDAGVTIHYIARWMNRVCDLRPISETTSTTSCRPDLAGKGEP